MTQRHGPYTTSSGHLFWIDVRPDGSRKSVFVHREMMEQHLGRRLGESEVVHHRNGDPADNRIENFEVKQRGQHTKDHRAGGPEMIEFICAWCQTTTTRLARAIRNNQLSKCKRGPFCGKSCAGKWSRRQQLEHARLAQSVEAPASRAVQSEFESPA